MVPPAGLEPALPASEAGALSTELRGLETIREAFRTDERIDRVFVRVEACGPLGPANLEVLMPHVEEFAIA